MLAVDQQPRQQHPRLDKGRVLLQAKPQGLLGLRRIVEALAAGQAVMRRQVLGIGPQGGAVGFQGLGVVVTVEQQVADGDLGLDLGAPLAQRRLVVLERETEQGRVVRRQQFVGAPERQQPGRLGAVRVAVVVDQSAQASVGLAALAQQALEPRGFHLGTRIGAGRGRQVAAPGRQGLAVVAQGLGGLGQFAPGRGRHRRHRGRGPGLLQAAVALDRDRRQRRRGGDAGGGLRRPRLPVTGRTGVPRGSDLLR